MEKILAQKQFSENTSKVYTSVIKRLEKLKFKFPMKQNEKIEYVESFFDEHFVKVGTKLDVLNIIIVLRTILELPIDKLKDLRSRLQKERINKNVTNMKEVTSSLTSYDEFKKELYEAYNRKEYLRFIVNYLLFNYGCRNMDCDLEIVKSVKEMNDPKQNYLLLKPKSVIWIRNNYKTYKTFGKQEINIDSEEFLTAVKKHGIGRLFKQSQLSNGIKKVLIKGMNEARIFKMLIDNAYDNKDTEEINRLSKTRGTSIQVIKDFYNVNANQEIIRAL